MAVNGKQKGNKFERDVANTLCERFSPDIGIEKPFRRNPDSGSFFGGTNIERKEIYDTDWAVYGDLICPRNFRFAIECKHYQSPPSFNSIINNNVKQWDNWLAQARQDAEASGKEMMLIIKYNRVDMFVFIEASLNHSGYVLEYNGARLILLEDILKEDYSFFFET